MIIKVTGQGTQIYPHKSYVEVTPIIEAGVTLRYSVDGLNAVYIPANEAEEVVGTLPTHTQLIRGNRILKVDPEFVFAGYTANEYNARFVNAFGDTSLMNLQQALAFSDWYTKFGQTYVIE